MSTQMARHLFADSEESPAQLAARLLKARIGETDGEALAFVVDRSRIAGNAAFRAGRFRGARGEGEEGEGQGRGGEGSGRGGRARRRAEASGGSGCRSRRAARGGREGETSRCRQWWRASAAPRSRSDFAVPPGFVHPPHFPRPPDGAPSSLPSVAEALTLYSQALAGAPSDAPLLSNRSACHLSLGDAPAALEDALEATRASPAWPKAWFRVGAAYEAMGQVEEALAAFSKAQTLVATAPDAAEKGAGRTRAPRDPLIDARVERLAAQLERRRSSRNAQSALQRRSLSLRLREARRADARESALRGFRGSMTAPDWELEDLDWRPTFLPQMRFRGQKEGSSGDLGHGAKGGRGAATDAGALVPPLRASTLATARYLSDYVDALADLAAPKACVPRSGDGVRFGWFADRVIEALEGAGAGSGRPPARSPLILSYERGSGVLPLAISRALAAAGLPHRVVAAQRGRMLFRMAQLTADENVRAGTRGADRVALLDCAIRVAKVEEGEAEGKEPERDAREGRGCAEGAADVARAAPASSASGPEAGSSAAPARDAPASPAPAPTPACRAVSTLPSRASLFVTDAFDHAGLGLGALRALDAACDAGLLTPDARVVPGTLRLYGRLVRAATAPAEGLDLSPLDRYRWGFYPEPVAPREASEFEALSEPFEVAAIDLQERFDARMRRAGEGKGGCAIGRAAGDGGETDTPAAADEAALGATAPPGAFAASTAMPAAATAPTATPAASTSPTPTSTSTPTGATATSPRASPYPAFESDEVVEVVPTATGRCNAVLLWVVSESSGRASAPPASYALQYVDGAPAVAGQPLELRVCRDADRVLVQPLRHPDRRPRHERAPKWHFEMVGDSLRNAAYARALRRAVRDLRRRGCAAPHALDVGAGSGLLSMLAVRAGAASASAVEISAPMCDVADDAVMRNGFLGSVEVINRDVRRLAGPVPLPDGSPADLPTAADLVVFELFDCGLIGEGVLHALRAVKSRLAKPNATYVPRRARVFVQPASFWRESVRMRGGGEEEAGGRDGGAAGGAAGGEAASVASLSAPVAGTTGVESAASPTSATEAVCSESGAAVVSSREAGADAILVSSTNAWRWREDYEGLELGLPESRGLWRPLAAPRQAFEFDFADAERNAAPQERVLPFDVDLETAWYEEVGSADAVRGGGAEDAMEDAARGGEEDTGEDAERRAVRSARRNAGIAAARRLVNLRGTSFAPSSSRGGAPAPRSATMDAVVVFFELDLDDEDALSTSPYGSAPKGLTWPQAVYWLPPRVVRHGERLCVDASHDTYSFAFKASDGCGRGCMESVPLHGAPPGPSTAEQPSGPSPTSPGGDPVWRAALEALKPLNASLTKACVQNPLEYRRIATAAIEVAARPGAFGVDPVQAAEFAAKLMG